MKLNVCEDDGHTRHPSELVQLQFESGTTFLFAQVVKPVKTDGNLFNINLKLIFSLRHLRVCTACLRETGIGFEFLHSSAPLTPQGWLQPEGRLRVAPAWGQSRAALAWEQGGGPGPSSCVGRVYRRDAAETRVYRGVPGATK